MDKKAKHTSPVAKHEQEDDVQLHETLRPKKLAEYVGQEKIKQNLHILMEAAKQRKESIEHVLLAGSPGLGKTTLAHIIAHEMGASIRTAAGPTLERAGDLAAILTNLEDGDILFIDEIHRLNPSVEELLYPAMEDHALDLVIGKGPAARTLRIDLPHFTLVGATTKTSLLAAPLRDRFGATYHLNFYELSDIARILERSARILNVHIQKTAIDTIASRARRTPRIANRILKRVRDYAQVKGDGNITAPLAEEALTHLDVDIHGLDAVDRRILEIIITKFQGGPVGLNTIAAATGEEMATIEEVYEPFLIQMGFLDRTPRGRVATKHAYQHLGIQPPQRQQLL